MSKKIKTTYQSIVVNTTNYMCVDVSGLKFMVDEQIPFVYIYDVDDNESLTLIDEIDILNDDYSQKINNLEELKVFAINWYFDNVEVVERIEL